MLDSRTVIYCAEKEIVIEGFIFKVNPSNVEIRLDSDLFQTRLHFQDHVSFTIFHPHQGQKTYEGDLLSSHPEHIVIENPVLVDTKQRRYDSRAQIQEFSKIYKVTLPGKPELELPKAIPFEVLNISASGILLSSQLELPSNVVFNFLLDFVGIEVNVEVVRAKKEGNKVFYGCKFINLTEEQQTRIRQFVFKKQMEERKTAT